MIKDIAKTASHRAVLTYNDTICMSANNDSSKFNKITYFKDNKISIKQIIGGESCLIIITNDNSIYTWGLNSYGELGLGDNIARDIPTELTYFKNENIAIERIPPIIPPI